MRDQYVWFWVQQIAVALLSHKNNWS